MTDIKHPHVLWSSEDNTNPGVSASAMYDDDTREFIVMVSDTVSSETERFPALYPPVWGIDAEDMRVIEEVAGRLSDKFRERK
jgi:hypothetical protein